MSNLLQQPIKVAVEATWAFDFSCRVNRLSSKYYLKIFSPHHIILPRNYIIKPDYNKVIPLSLARPLCVKDFWVFLIVFIYKYHGIYQRLVMILTPSITHIFPHTFSSSISCTMVNMTDLPKLPKSITQVLLYH